MSDPFNAKRNSLPQPHRDFAGPANNGGLFAKIAKFWQPKDSTAETAAATVSRYSLRLIDQVTGKAYSADELLENNISSLDPNEALRSLRVIGADRLTEDNKSALERLFMARERRNWQIAGSSDQSRMRVVDLGDSVTAPFGRHLARRMGQGGQFFKTNTANGNGMVATNASVLVDQWAKTLSGAILRITNAGTLIFAPTVQLTGIWIQYIAKNGGGTITLAHDRGKRGSYIDADRTWTIESYSRYGWGFSGSPTIMCTDTTGLAVGMTATASNIPGGTTISAIDSDVSVSTTGNITSGSAVVTLASTAGLSIGMRVETTAGQGALISSINVGASQVTLSGNIDLGNQNGLPFTFRGKRITLSANLTGNVAAPISFTRPNSGSTTAGVLNTNNSSTEQFCTAFIPVPSFIPWGADIYNIRLTVSGTVDICGIGTENGAFGFAWDTTCIQPGGVCWGNYGEGGKLVSTHFNTTPQDVFDRSLGWINPDIITFKGLNDWNLASLTSEVSPGLTLWDQYMGKIHSAAPNALILVFSSHPTYAHPDPDDANDGFVQMNAWMRDWCARSGYAKFIDALQNYPDNSQIQGDPANTTSDGLHQYDTSGNDIRGFGENYNALLAIDAVMPVLQGIGPWSGRSRLNNTNRLLGGDFNRITLSPLDGANALPDYAPLYAEVPPRCVGAFLFRAAESIYNGGTAHLFDKVTGIAVRPAGNMDAGINPFSLRVLSAGNIVMACGNKHFQTHQFWGMAFNMGTTEPTDARLQNGYRFLNPEHADGQKEGVIAEARAGSTSRTLGVNSGATTSSEGTLVFGWYGESGNYVCPKTIVAPGSTGDRLGVNAINKISGRVNFANGATTLRVDNSLVTAASIINVTKATNNSTARLGAVVADAGFFTIHMDVAPNAECAVNFMVSN